MKPRSVIRPVAFDPFGEPAEFARANPPTTGDRTTRIAAIAVFWTLALLLLAGRVYVGDQFAGQAVASVQSVVAVAQAAAFR